jgi:general secretion pathway protein F
VRYEIKAVGSDSQVTLLTLDADDTDDAKRLAATQGYTVLGARPTHPLHSWRLGRRARFPLLLFSQELLALIEAGLTLVEAVETLLEKEHRPEAKHVLQQIIQAIYEGHPLSFALQQFPAHFPPLYVATIRASERTGDIGESLSRYVAYQMQMEVVRKKVVSASIYPALLLIAGSVVTTFLMAYVVPKFSGIYEEVGGNLPLLSQLLMKWGRLLDAHGMLMLGGFTVGVAALGYLTTRPAARRWLAHKLWQIPALGRQMRIYQLARFYRTLGMLLRGGTPVVTALTMASGLLPTALRHQMDQAAASIREGKSISQAMEHHGLTTPIALRMLRVGERSGKMGEMMGRIATFYDDEMSRAVDWFTKLFEPLLMAFIGLVIGGIVVLMYFPIFQLAGSIQ